MGNRGSRAKRAKAKAQAQPQAALQAPEEAQAFVAPGPPPQLTPAEVAVILHDKYEQHQNDLLQGDQQFAMAYYEEKQYRVERHFQRNKIRYSNDEIVEMFISKNFDLSTLRALVRNNLPNELAQSNVVPADAEQRLCLSLLVALNQLEFDYRFLSESLTHFLAKLSFDTTEGRPSFLKDDWMNLAPIVEQITVTISTDYWTWMFVLIYQQQLRVLNLKIVYPGGSLPNLIKVSTNQRGCASLFGPKFRSLTLANQPCWFGQDEEAVVVVVSRHGPNLTSLKLESVSQTIVWEGLSVECPAMQFHRLKHLSLRFPFLACVDSFNQYLRPNVHWHQLDSCALHLFVRPFDAQLFDIFALLNEMTQLSKLSITISYDEGDEDFPIRYYDNPNENVIYQWMADKMTALMAQARLFKGSAKMEVLRLSVQLPSQLLYQSTNVESLITIYEIYDIFMSRLRASLQKLIIEVPSFMQVANHLSLNVSQLKVKTLILDYSKYSNKMYAHDVRHFARWNITQLVTEERNNKTKQVLHLTLLNLPMLNSTMMHNISNVFPNLVELNIGAFKPGMYAQFQDANFAQMITRLESLRTLRFLDDDPKVSALGQTISAMYHRAEAIKPKVPMVLRIPLDGNFWMDDDQSRMRRQEFPQSKWLHIY